MGDHKFFVMGQTLESCDLFLLQEELRYAALEDSINISGFDEIRLEAIRAEIKLRLKPKE